ncbi:MAG: class I SAM-dependent methyltransferase [Pseudomonadales bacterium]|nr:class I SAM-dependent methyltransferase [Pseudomonadales bacterium]
MPDAVIGLVYSPRLREVESQILNLNHFISVDSVEDAVQSNCIAVLFWQEDKLFLQSFSNQGYKPFTIDWAMGKSDYRRTHGGRGELIAKAVGVKKGFLPSVIDTTAGLGQDSFVLAGIGCQVTMLERSHAVRAMLWDGLRRAKESSTIGMVANNMSLVSGDSVKYLESIAPLDPPDVVYCDPMFPARSKSALVKKEMRVFKDIVGEDKDAALLLHQALKVAKKRVVVKRPKKAPRIDDSGVIDEGSQNQLVIQSRSSIEPSHSIEGKTCRFDVYIINRPEMTN